MDRTAIVLLVVGLMATLIAAAPATVAEETTQAEEKTGCVRVSLAPPSAGVDVDCVIEEILPQPAHFI